MSKNDEKFAVSIHNYSLGITLYCLCKNGENAKELHYWLDYGGVSLNIVKIKNGRIIEEYSQAIGGPWKKQKRDFLNKVFFSKVEESQIFTEKFFLKTEKNGKKEPTIKYQEFMGWFDQDEVEEDDF